MKLWKLMIGAVAVSVFMVWACVAIDGTIQAQEQVSEAQSGQHMF